MYFSAFILIKYTRTGAEIANTMILKYISNGIEIFMDTEVQSLSNIQTRR